MSIRSWFQKNVFGEEPVEKDTTVMHPDGVIHAKRVEGGNACGDDGPNTCWDTEVTCEKCRHIVSSKGVGGVITTADISPTRRMLGGPINPVADPVSTVRRTSTDYRSRDDSSDLMNPLNPLSPLSPVSPISFYTSDDRRCSPPDPIVAPPSVPDSSPSQDSGAGDYCGSSWSGGDYGGSTDCGPSSCDSGGG